MSDVVNTTGQEKQGYVEKVVKKKAQYVVSIETTMDELVKCVEKGQEIVWKEDDLPKFEEKDLEVLPYKVAKGYVDALKKREQKEKAALGSFQVIDILGGNSLNKLKLRKRPGYHQTWKRPDEFDEALSYGYVQVRKAKDGDKVGYEKGEVIKIGDKDKPELIAMEIRQDVYDRHVKAVSMKSRRAYTGIKENFAGVVEQVNRTLPKGSDRVVVVDDEGDVG